MHLQSHCLWIQRGGKQSIIKTAPLMECGLNCYVQSTKNDVNPKTKMFVETK